jgi:PHD/YefM family antitoxin component YafN of YafNO toxin-antitoxin module
MSRIAPGLPGLSDRGKIEFDRVFVQGATGMLDTNRDINSPSNSKRNTPEFLRQLKETGQPVVLTINGQAELIVQDPASYEKLIELAERAEEMEALREAVEEMRAGKGRPIEEMFAEMEQILAEMKSR